MSSIARSGGVLAALFALSATALADFDAAWYHDENCTGCHGTEMYTRDDRRMDSYAALQAQVERCDANLGTKLFPDDIEALVEHLNTQFYKFEN